MLSLFPAAALRRRDRFLIPGTLILITVLAWAYLIHLDRRMSSDMEHDKAMAAMGMTVYMPWTAADALFAFGMWAVMMVGMMTPAAAPVLVLFAAAQARRSERGASLVVFMFGLGYVAIWTGFSAGAALVQFVLQQTSMLSAAMAASRPQLAGTILIAAGAYQLTSWKSRCLTHCRSPLGFLMTNWRDGKFGSFKMGIRHGVYCLGCCWALMGVLFAVGVMNLVWVAALSGLVLLEKVGPAGAVTARIAGAAMILIGVVEIVIIT